MHCYCHGYCCYQQLNLWGWESIGYDAIDYEEMLRIDSQEKHKLPPTLSTAGERHYHHLC